MPYFAAGESKQQEKLAGHWACQQWQCPKGEHKVLSSPPEAGELPTGEIAMASSLRWTHIGFHPRF